MAKSIPSADVGGQLSLHSELLRASLPQASQEPGRVFAWVDSICAIFIAVGLLGTFFPQIIFHKTVEKVQEAMPVLFTPPDEPPPPVDQAEEPPPETATDVVEQPVVATVVAADISNVSFSVPVHGPVTFAPAQFASAPPRNTKQGRSAPVVFRGAGSSRNFPLPNYPEELRRQKIQGEGMLRAIVGTNGLPLSVEVKETSGSTLLDREMIRVVRGRWKWEEGSEREFFIPFQFKL